MEAGNDTIYWVSRTTKLMDTLVENGYFFEFYGDLYLFIKKLESIYGKQRIWRCILFHSLSQSTFNDSPEMFLDFDGKICFKNFVIKSEQKYYARIDSEIE